MRLLREPLFHFLIINALNDRDVPEAEVNPGILNGSFEPIISRPPNKIFSKMRGQTDFWRGSRFNADVRQAMGIRYQRESIVIY
jgi:hypothetical protein